jgi:hypothetical protein
VVGPSHRARRCAARLLAAAAIACLVGVGAAGAATPPPKALCSPMLPPRAHLPTGIGLPQLASATLPISANAQSHHALCRIGVYSPSDGARYNVNWYVFPSHKLALADLATLDVHAIYAAVTSEKPVAGFPKPDYLLTGKYLYLGRVESIISISFVDGPALVSGSMLGGGTVAQARALARWAEQDITKIEARG